MSAAALGPFSARLRGESPSRQRERRGGRARSRAARGLGRLSAFGSARLSRLSSEEVLGASALGECSAPGERGRWITLANSALSESSDRRSTVARNAGKLLATSRAPRHPGPGPQGPAQGPAGPVRSREALSSLCAFEGP